MKSWPSLRSDGRTTWAWWLALAVIATLYAVMAWMVPWQYDDLMFIDVYHCHNGGEDAFSLRAWWDYITEIRTYDNGRLANILAPVALLWLPRWVWCMIVGVCTAAVYGLVTRLAGYRSALMLLIVWLIGMYLLPWRNNIIVCDYVLNYVLTSAAAMAMLRCLKGKGAWCLLFAVLTGLMHEGFAMPLIAGIGVWLLLQRFKAPWLYWLAFAGLIIGLLWPISAPGIWARLGREAGGMSLAQQIHALAVFAPLSCVLTVVTAGWWLNSRWRQWLKTCFANPIWVICASGAVISAVMVVMVQPAARNGWPCHLFALTALLIMARQLPWPHFGPITRRIIAVCIGVFLCVIWANAFCWQYRFMVQHRHIERLMSASPIGTAYFDYIEPQLMPRLLTAGLPVKTTWIEPFQYECLNITRRPRHRYAVVPEALSDWRPGRGRAQQGIKGLELYKGVWVTTDTVLNNNNLTGSIIYVNLYDRQGRLVAGNVQCAKFKYLYAPDSMAATIRPIYWNVK